MATTPVVWPGEFHGLYIPWGHEELVKTEQFSPRTSGLIFFCPNIDLGLRCCANLCFIYAYSLCYLPHPFPRCSSQSSQPMWLPYLCHHPLLRTSDLLSSHQWFGYHIPLHIYSLSANASILIPPTLNPMVYGIKTKQIRDLVVHLLFPKQI